MAEVTGLRNNALPYPIYGVPFGIVYPMLDADGDPVTGATTPDAERSLNGDTFADCTNESTEIATSSGVYYLLLTAAEMTADVVAIIAKSATTGMKTTVITLYPRKLAACRTGTAAGGASSSITLDSGAPAIDDYYNGCVVVGVLDGTTEARTITNYTGSSKVADVVPNWNTTPDSDDTFTIYHTENSYFKMSDVMAWNATAVATPHTAGYPVVTVKDGTGTGEIDTASGVVLAKDHTGAALATASAVDAVDNFVDTEITAIQTSISALNNISTSQVNAEVVDALNTDTYAEPGQGNPAATASLVTKIGFLYKAWRNRSTQTSGEYALYADDATTKDQEAITSDNGTTFDRGEVSTGA